jgi:hypothetical protein
MRFSLHFIFYPTPIIWHSLFNMYRNAWIDATCAITKISIEYANTLAWCILTQASLCLRILSHRVKAQQVQLSPWPANYYCTPETAIRYCGDCGINCSADKLREAPVSNHYEHLVHLEHLGYADYDYARPKPCSAALRIVFQLLQWLTQNCPGTARTPDGCAHRSCSS